MNKIIRYLTVFVLIHQTHVSATPTSTWEPAPLPSPQSSCSPFPSPEIQLRFPPTIRNDTPPNWTAPPYAWIFGNWWVTHSSRLSYQTFYNFQADTYPSFPTNEIQASERQNIDLTSWNVAKTGNATIDEHIYTVFGYDTPVTDLGPGEAGGGVYLFNGTGTLSILGNYWEIMAWGYDRNGHGYRAEFETASPHTGDEPCIDIVSRSETGPDETTLAEIVAGMRRLFDGSGGSDDGDLGLYVANLTRLPNDGRRSGLGPVACGVDCVNNMNLPPR